MFFIIEQGLFVFLVDRSPGKGLQLTQRLRAGLPRHAAGAAHDPPGLLHTQPRLHARLAVCAHRPRSKVLHRPRAAGGVWPGGLRDAVPPRHVGRDQRHAPRAGAPDGPEPHDAALAAACVPGVLVLTPAPTVCHMCAWECPRLQLPPVMWPLAPRHARNSPTACTRWALRLRRCLWPLLHGGAVALRSRRRLASGDAAVQGAMEVYV